jgi:hypothetical protein
MVLKRTYLFVCICLLFPFITTAQFGPKQNIAIDADGVRAIEAVDLNGDGFKDVLAALKFGSSIVWYENLAGSGQFGTQQLISILDQPIHLNSNDLDDDGDFDIIGISSPSNLVVWYKNLDGQATFGAGIEVVNNPLDAANQVKSADLDGDGDIDIIASSDTFDDIFWFENLDGAGTFSARKVVGLFGNNGRHFAIDDLDGDGDMDVVASSSNTETLSWYKNVDGLGTFSDFIEILPSDSATTGVFIADLDGDLDNDIVYIKAGTNSVNWVENLDGLGDFSQEKTISTLVLGADAVFAGDLDNDGDIDIVSAGSSNNRIITHENLDGLGDFGAGVILYSGMQTRVSLYAADLDNDGDMDIISGSQNDDTIAWFENLTILGIEDQVGPQVRIFPNPAKTVLYIDVAGQTITAITVYTLQGKKVFNHKGAAEQIAIENLATGVYFISITSQEGTMVKKFVKE